MANQVNVFIAFAPNDNSYFEALQKHLVVLDRNPNIHFWYEDRTEFGKNKEVTLAKELEQADFILLMLSADMVASDFYQNKMLPNLQHFKDKEVKVIPIIIRETLWDEELFDKRLILPKNGVWSDDIGYWKNPDKFYVHVASKIIEWVDDELNNQGIASDLSGYEKKNTKNKYKQGKVLYLIPEQMELLKRHNCLIRIAPEEISLDELKKGIKNISEANIQDIRIDSLMKAEIIDDTDGEYFDINLIGDLEQAIEEDGYTDWQYSIKPLKEGVHSLWLKISVMVRIPELDKLAFKNIVVLDKKIMVSTFIVEQQESWQVAENQTIPFSAVNLLKEVDDSNKNDRRKLSKIILPLLLGILAFPAFAMFAFTDWTTSVYLKLAYDEHRMLQDERIAVKKNGQWGFVNKWGIESTKPMYDKVGNFSNGIATVGKNGQETRLIRATNQSGWQAIWNPIDYPCLENDCTCHDNYCGLNGSCINKICICKNGFTGDRCQTPPFSSDPCKDIDCGLNGNCVDGICICKNGYSGDRCQTPPAPSDPCKDIDCGLNGKCVNGICICKNGYKGSHCQTPPSQTDPCININCGLNGTCLNGICKCKNGYTGLRCEHPPQKTDICAELRCTENGTCNPVTKVCDCKPGYSGKRCQLKSGLCYNVNCGRNGTCNPETGKCDCKNGYTGDKCQTPPPDLCKNVKCLNYGTCDPKTGKCNCTNGFSGDRCQTPPNLCKDVFCKNNGTCDPKTGKCICQPGFYGDRCEYEGLK
ncbi:MAG: hypothetical protein IPM47_08950 [Sphingobacteriales bacterium]|nr:MAG: hypothetical protein IPM47_08950 [Sphingobacteriales bacterium]